MSVGYELETTTEVKINAQYLTLRADENAVHSSFVALSNLSTIVNA